MVRRFRSLAEVCGILLSLFVTLAAAKVSAADPTNPAPALSANTVEDLSLRSIGPALTPGRVADIAIDSRNRNVWYVATASSGLWKTSNRGMTGSRFSTTRVRTHWAV